MRRRTRAAREVCGAALPVTLAVAATTLLLVSGCISGPASRSEEAHGIPVSERAATDLHVGSFNIRMLFTSDDSRAQWEERRHAIVAVIRKERPAVLGLQEVETHGHGVSQESEQLLFLREALPEYQFALQGTPTEAPSSNPILYDPMRLEFEDGGFYFFSKTPDVIYSVDWGAGDPVYATWARFRDRLTDQTFTVHNVHFDHIKGRSKRNAARIVTERLTPPSSGDAVIVLGDFNAFRNSAPLRTLQEAGLSHALPPSRTGSYHFFSGITLWPRIDHILTTSHFSADRGHISYYKTEAGYPSDHFPVFVTLKMSDG